MTTPRTRLILMIAMTAVAICGTTFAQTLIGSPGAGWQTWSLSTDVNGNFIDLNSNGAPFWDVPFLAFGNYHNTNADKSVGWCLTSTGDCQGVGSAPVAPGPIPFWGMPYDPVADNPIGPAPGALDKKVYFRTNSAGQSFQATLYLNTATNNREINEFGWFETDATGSVNGTKHVLFQGSGYPPGTLMPDPVGKTVTFAPTQYFGFYYEDVSDPETLNGPEHGCWAYTIFTFNDEDCTQAGAGVMSPVRETMSLQYSFNRIPSGPPSTGSRAKIPVGVVKMAIATSLS